MAWLGFFRAELFGPCHERPPDKLVQKQDDAHHGEDPQKLRGPVSIIDRHAHIRTDAWQSEVVFSENECLTDCEKKPAARHRHHAVPDEAVRGERKVEPEKALPP